MTTISNVDKSGVVDAAAFSSSTSAAPSGGESLLPEPPSGCGDVTELAALMTELDGQDRKNATAVRDAADQGAAKDDAARVAAMMDRADVDRGSALASGIGEIVGGAATIGGAAFARPATDTASTSHSWNWGTALDGASKIAPGVGTVVSGGAKARGEKNDAQAAQYEAASSAEGRLSSQAQDDVQSAVDAAEKTEQTLAQILQTEAATRLAAAGPGH